MTYHKAAGDTERAAITCDQVVGHRRIVPPRAGNVVDTEDVLCAAFVDRAPTDQQRGVLDRQYTADILRAIARQLGWKVRHKSVDGYKDLCPQHKPAPRANPTPFGMRWDGARWRRG